MKDDKGTAGKTLLRNLYRILLLKPIPIINQNQPNLRLMFLSYRKQSVELQDKSSEWFLYHDSICFKWLNSFNFCLSCRKETKTKYAGIIVQDTWAHPFSTYAKPSEKQTFLTTWYVHVRVSQRTGNVKFLRIFCVRTKWPIPFAMPQ